MTHEEFDQLVREVEAGPGREPRALRRRVLWLALLGYAGLAAPLGLVLVVGLALIIPGILWPQDALPLSLLGAVVLALGGWAAGRGLLISTPPPEGRPVTRAETPELFAVVDNLRRRLRAAPFAAVLITGSCNAAVAHRPRLGVLGWNRNYLLLGLPLLDSLTREEMTAVLAHECAHHSKQHHWSGQWIYRLRRSWEQVFEEFSRPRVQGHVSLRPVTLKFINWFWPRFNAHAFVLSRAQEYQADAVAAELAGAGPAADALIRIAWYGRVLGEKFWPELWLLANTRATPPADVFLRLGEFAGKIGLRDDVKWLEQAFSSTTTNADTHPCLSERLRAIGREPAAAPDLAALAPPPARPTAASLLGASLTAVRADVEQAWRKETGPAWLRQHGKAGILQERLTSLDHTIVVKSEDTDALWDKARVLLEMHDEVSALPLLRQVLDRDPRHVAANFHLGRCLLDAGDGAGEAHLERAIAGDEELLPQAGGLLHAYYQEAGRLESIRELYARLDRHEKSLAASRLERSQVSAADKLLAHDLGEAELAALRAALAAEPEIIAANLGRKELQHFVQQKLYLLCVRTRPAWHRLSGASRAEPVIQRLVKTVHLPGRVLVFSRSGFYGAVARKLCQISGTTVLPQR